MCMWHVSCLNGILMLEKILCDTIAQRLRVTPLTVPHGLQVPPGSAAISSFLVWLADPRFKRVVRFLFSRETDRAGTRRVARRHCATVPHRTFSPYVPLKFIPIPYMSLKIYHSLHDHYFSLYLSPLCHSVTLTVRAVVVGVAARSRRSCSVP